MWYWVVEMMRGIEKVMGKREGRKRGFVCVCVGCISKNLLGRLSGEVRIDA